MGLYLTIFDGDEEIEGVEIGSYSDFDFMRRAVAKNVEKGAFGFRCPTLMHHEDSDGEWTPNEALKLEKELRKIKRVFERKPPVEFDDCWQATLIETEGLKVQTLNDCFFDVDGEPLFDRIIALTIISQDRNLPILFQ